MRRTKRWLAAAMAAAGILLAAVPGAVEAQTQDAEKNPVVDFGESEQEYEVHYRADFKSETSGTAEMTDKKTEDGYCSVVSDKNFRITLKAEKRDLAEGKPVELTAQIEYIGKKDSISIVAGDPMLVFHVAGSNGLGLTEYVAEVDSAKTVLEKGKIYQLKLEQDDHSVTEGSCDWSAEGLPILPNGTYTVKAGLAKDYDNASEIKLYATLHVNVGVTGKVFVKGNNLYRVLSGSKAAIIGTTQEKGAFTVPSKITYGSKTYTVTQVGDAGHDEEYMDADDGTVYTAYHGTFGEKEFTSVTIPSTVTKIESNAFSNLSKLKKIMISGKKISIGAHAFEYAGSGGKVTKGTIQISGTEVTVEECAFRYAYGMNTLILKATKKAVIEDEAFRGTPLKSISLPSRLTSIGDFAFDGTTGTVTIPAGVMKIGDGFTTSGKVKISSANKKFKIKNGALYSKDGKKLMLYFNKSATSFSVPETVNTVQAYAFYKSKLKKLTLPGSVTKIPEGMCYDSEKLTTVNFGIETKSIGDKAFMYCSKLSKATLPDMVTSIGSRAFWLTKLSKVRIPATVKSIGTEAFYTYGKYIDFRIDDENKVYEQQNDLIYDRKSGELVMMILQKSDNGTLTIPSGITELENLEIVNYWGMWKMELPACLKKVNTKVFRYCVDSEDWDTAVFNGWQPPVVEWDEDTRFYCYAVVPDGSEDLYKEAMDWKGRPGRLAVYKLSEYQNW